MGGREVLPHVAGICVVIKIRHGAQTIIQYPIINSPVIIIPDAPNIIRYFNILAGLSSREFSTFSRSNSEDLW